MQELMGKSVNRFIGLEYLENTFESDEIKELESGLNMLGIDLKVRSNPPKPIMGIENLFPQIQILLSSNIVQEICLGVVTGAIWDGIKLFFKSLRKMVKKKPFTRVSNGKADTKATPNIYVNIGKSHIVLPMDIDDKKFEYFVDKMFETINQDTTTEEKYAFYDSKNETLEYYSRHEIATKLYKQQEKRKNDTQNDD